MSKTISLPIEGGITTGSNEHHAEIERRLSALESGETLLELQRRLAIAEQSITGLLDKMRVLTSDIDPVKSINTLDRRLQTLEEA